MSKIQQELVSACSLDVRGKTTEQISRDILNTISNNPMLLNSTGISMEAMDWTCDSLNQLNMGFSPLDFPDMENPVETRKQAYKTGASHREINRNLHPKGAAWRAKEIMIEEGLSISLKDLHDKLLSEEYVYSIQTLQIVCTEFRNCIKFLDKKGYLAGRAIKE